MHDQASETDELTARISAEWNLGEEDVAATAEDAETLEALSMAFCVDI